MDSLDGYLQVPPDRSQILGRQSWKTRYIVVGPCAASGKSWQGSSGFCQRPRGNSVLPKPLTKTATDELYLSVYKSKEDSEPMQKWRLGDISDCEVQSVSHRKQAPVLPTLVITISDTQRKRRSSRATGFISTNKDSSATILLFRTPPHDDDHISLEEWSRVINTRKASAIAIGNPMSPMFTSPFQTRPNEISESHPRPSSSSRGLQHKSSTATYSTGPWDRSFTFSSESPSLRSKRSDLSSPSSHTHLTQNGSYPIPEQHYTTIMPGDIVASSPNGEYQGQFIEGWAATQRRFSAMTSPIRGRNSISSQSQQRSILDVASPPAPGESILDRAFQLGQIPGARSLVPGEENLSSIARFDALMRDTEERRRRRETIHRIRQTGTRVAVDHDGKTIEDRNEDGKDLDESESDSDAFPPNLFRNEELSATPMSPSTQRALAYIAERHEQRPPMSRTHLSFHAGIASAPAPAPVLASRPHTAYAKSGPNASPGQTASHMIPTATTTLTLLPSPREEDHGRSTRSTEKLCSNSSSKRSSFTEFTKRLSSTSSLLLGQTNTSGASSHVSSDEADTQNCSSAPRTNLGLRGSGASPRPRDRYDQDRRCGWRGSVSMVRPEGAFTFMK